MTQKSDSSMQFVFSCPLPSGLHARPASHLAEIANQFVSDCTLTNLRNGLAANCKSVLGIISADIRHGDTCSLHLNGPDDAAARAALQRFIEEALPQCDVPLAGIAASTRSNKIPRPLQAANATCIFGTPISRGIGHGPVVILKRMTLPANVDGQTGSNPSQEQQHIKDAVAVVLPREDRVFADLLARRGLQAA